MIQLTSRFVVSDSLGSVQKYLSGGGAGQNGGGTKRFESSKGGTKKFSTNKEGGTKSFNQIYS